MVTKGNRLPGESTTRHNIYVGNQLWESFGEFCEKKETTRSEELRRYMARCIGQTKGDNPNQERLAKGLATLRTIAGPNGRVPGSTAKIQLSQDLGIPKSEVSRIILSPLDSMGYISTPRIGTIEVTDSDRPD